MRLREQVERNFRGDPFLSIKARTRYREACLRFVQWAAEATDLADIWQLQPAHVEGYVQQMLSRGRKPRTIRTDVSALKHLHNILALAGKARWEGELPDPSHLHVPAAEEVPDRSWTEPEMHLLVQRSLAAGQERYADMIRLAWELGLRIHEVARLLRAQCEHHALQDGTLKVVGKGGKKRAVPLTPAALAILERYRRRTKRGRRLFVQEGETAGQVIKTVQDFIRKHRPDPEPGYSPLTFHGLRYSYAQREDRRLAEAGQTRRQRQKEVSRRLGHNRPQITKTYVRY